MPPFRLVLVLAALALLGGCKKKIGDPCVRSTDCSIRGDRSCDLSHRVNSAGTPTPGGSGECTIENCGANTCPKQSECVKVYGSDFLTVACDPTREDRATLGNDDDCVKPRCLAAQADAATCEQLCAPDDDSEECTAVCPPRDDCQANEICLPEGLCADDITARTSCRRRCNEDKDCRAGYECTRTGARGVYHAPDLDHPGQVDEVSICAPRAI